ncbi:MAG: DNA mismatch repair protein MutS [Sphingomonadaceae bacterium]
MDQLTFLEPPDPPVSPIRRQYLDLKRRYPDAILLFRLGDFYETFDDDAYLVSSELEIVLTGREMGKGERVPLAGIPYHAAEGYIARLLAKGHKVALAEQLGAPGRGLMARDVVRVITPGTLIEDSLLPSRANNYLASLVTTPEGAGLAWVDISTGEFSATEIRLPDWRSHVAAEMERCRPAECLLPRSHADDESVKALLPSGVCATPREDVTFAQASCERLLREHFKVATLDGFGLDSAPLAARAAGSLLSYLQEMQPASLGELESLHLYSLDRQMKLDAAARRNLELTANAVTGSVEGSLLGVLDRTRTAMGGRLLRRWIGQPLLDVASIEARLDGVEELVGSPLGRAEMGDALSTLGDLERLASRAAQQSLSPRDCVAIARSLRAVPRIRRTLERWLPGLLKVEGDSLDPCEDVADAIERTIAEEPAGIVGQGVIRAGRSRELDELRAISGDTRQWIAGLERTERERTGVKSLKIGYNKVFGYYIEVTRPNLDAPTDEFARMKTGAGTIAELLESFGYQRKQTLANAERFVTPQLKEQEMRLQSAQEEIEALEKRIYGELLAELSGEAGRVRRTAQSLGRLDGLLSLAEVAVAGRYVRPSVDESTVISIRGGRHPVVERCVAAGEYVPNDCELDGESAQIAVLTGPNMAGKSTYVLGVALIVLMAQMGSFVPAEEARIGLVDRIFTRVGAQHDVSAGKSTFLVEMAETANVLHNATPRSLVVLDEVGRGTSTYDGMAIARAVIEYLHEEPRLRCKTLFATHYHELTELEALLPRVRNLRMDVLEEGGRVVFLHRVVPGGADRSYGIHVAQLAGVPAPVIRRARQILCELETKGAKVIGPETLGAGQVPEEHLRAIEELRDLDTTTMTPLQALAKLDELQKRVW